MKLVYFDTTKTGFCTKKIGQRLDFGDMATFPTSFA